MIVIEFFCNYIKEKKLKTESTISNKTHCSLKVRNLHVRRTYTSNIFIFLSPLKWNLAKE